MIDKIYCLADTYIDSRHEYSDKNFYSSSKLMTCQTNSYFTTIVQFKVPDYLKFKKVINVSINYEMQFNVPSGWYHEESCRYVQYRTLSARDEICSRITSNTFYSNQHGVLSSVTKIGKNIRFTPTMTNSYVVDDITGLYSNGINDGFFTLVINANVNQLFGFYDYETYIKSMESGLIYLTVNYDNVDIGRPIIQFPAETYLKQSDPITFKWLYQSSTGAMLEQSEINWRKKSDYVWKTIYTRGATESYTFSEYTFPIGIIEWRIKTYNEIWEESDYTYATFTVYGKPSVPIITNIVSTSIPCITWNTSEQASYEIEIKDGETILIEGAASTQDTTYTPNKFFPNGIYEVRLRICNEYGYWSEWTGKSFEINAKSPPKPSIYISPQCERMHIIAEFDTDIAYLYRAEGMAEAIPIAKLRSKRYIDTTVNSNTKYSYFIRAVDVGFADSENYQVKTSKFRGFTVSTDKYSVTIFRSLEKFLPFSEMTRRDKEINYYSGRENPTVEKGTHITHEINRVCFVTEDEYQILHNMYCSNNRYILYRDDRGRKMFCEVDYLPIRNELVNMGYELNLLFTETDYDEEVVLNEES